METDMPGHYGKPTFIIMKKQMLDGLMPAFGGVSYMKMKKSMHDDYMDDEEDEDEMQLEADPKHKGTIKQLKKTADALHKASKLHAEQAETLEGLIMTLSRSPDD